MKANEPLREQVCSGLSGRVIELGFGSGLNVPYYPATVTSVSAVEPADLGWKLAAGRLAEARVPVERAGLDGQRLPFPENSFDTALSTWTMCTIPDIDAALAELRRVLVPGGTLHFVEHGLSPDPKVQRWQHRLDPLQQKIAGGCHLNRDIATLIRAGGFEIRDLDVFKGQGPAFLDSQSLGVATAA